MQIIVNQAVSTWEAFVANNPELTPDLLEKIQTGLSRGSEFELNLGGILITIRAADAVEPAASQRPWELIVNQQGAETIAFIQVAGSNAGDVIVEIWNPEAEHLANLRLIVAAVNAYKP